MKSAMSMLTVLALAFCAGAAEPPPQAKAVKAKENPMLKLTGGYILRPGMKQGEVSFLNAQKAVPSSEFKPIAARLGKMLHLNFTVKDVEAGGGRGEFAELLKKDSAQFAVFIVDDPGNDDALVILPESRYAIVNVSPLRADGGEGAFLAARAKKEAVRAFFFVAGGASMPSEGNLMSAFPHIRDLDNVPADAFPVEIVGRVGEYLPKMGCETKAFSTYRRACKEGWAPPPTNDYQKAIWDKVHALPTEPIKIKPETKKVSN